MSARPIFDTLKQIRRGALLDEASDKMNELIHAIKQTSKAGELTISIKIEPVKGDADKVLIKGEATAKPPKPTVPSDLFYTTDDDNLSSKNPRQTEMELRTVDDDRGAPINVDPETGEILAG